MIIVIISRSFVIGIEKYIYFVHIYLLYGICAKKICEWGGVGGGVTGEHKKITRKSIRFAFKYDRHTNTHTARESVEQANMKMIVEK